MARCIFSAAALFTIQNTFFSTRQGTEGKGLAKIGLRLHFFEKLGNGYWVFLGLLRKENEQSSDLREPNRFFNLAATYRRCVGIFSASVFFLNLTGKGSFVSNSSAVLNNFRIGAK